MPVVEYQEDQFTERKNVRRSCIFDDRVRECKVTPCRVLRLIDNLFDYTLLILRTQRCLNNLNKVQRSCLIHCEMSLCSVPKHNPT